MVWIIAEMQVSRLKTILTIQEFPGDTPGLSHNSQNVGIAMPFAPSPIHHHLYGWDSNHQKLVKLVWFRTLLYPHHSKNYQKIGKQITTSTTFPRHPRAHLVRLIFSEDVAPRSVKDREEAMVRPLKGGAVAWKGNKHTLTAWWQTYPSERYEFVLG